MQQSTQKPALTVTDVKQILSIGTNSAYNLVRSRAFPVRKIGRSYRVPSAQFFEWLAQHDLTIAAMFNDKP